MTDKVSQKQAVIDAVVEKLGSTYDASVPVSDVLTDEQIEEIKDTVSQEILDGNVKYSKSLDEEPVKKYVSGMVSNHLRKAKELNGGVEYRPKNKRTTAPISTAVATSNPKQVCTEQPKADVSGIDVTILSNTKAATSEATNNSNINS